LESFENYRTLLFSIAYRMTGSVMEAEDLVQDTFLRYSAVNTAQIRSLRAFLITIITRLAINALESAHFRRENYFGSWLPKPVPTASNPQLVQPVDRESTYDSISSAFLLLLERLTPLERAVFVLKEVFDFPYAEIAQILDRTEVACRKLGARAKKHVTQGNPRFTVSMEHYQQVVEHFLQPVKPEIWRHLLSY
jgi:RNA polymerase sigma-70 factor, ECF subfamily